MCFICAKAMCPKCLPAEKRDKYPKGLIPVCSHCQEKVKHKEVKENDDKTQKHKDNDYQDKTGEGSSKKENPAEPREDSEKVVNKKKDDVCVHYLFKT